MRRGVAVFVAAIAVVAVAAPGASAKGKAIKLTATVISATKSHGCSRIVVTFKHGNKKVGAARPSPALR